MSQLKKSAALLLLSIVAMVVSISACTPEYTRQQSEEFAQQARLIDSIEIERSNQRLLSRQAQICLLSPDGGDEAGADLLRTMQVGLSGYFLAVTVVGESFDYLRAVASTTSCPGASYLFYVQPATYPVCDQNRSCHSVASQFVITVISAGDQSLVDRIQFSIKKSFLPLAGNEHERRQKAFEQLAIALTGVK